MVPCTHSFFLSVQRIAWTVFVFKYCVVVEVDPPPIKFILLLVRLASDHCFLLFTEVFSPTPGIFSFGGLSAVFNLGNLLRAPIRSWGSV